MALAAVAALAFSACASPSGQRLVAPSTTVVANTGSMLPGFNGGETIRIEACPFDANLLGQIIVSWRETRQSNVMHRVIALRYGARGQVVGVVTKGDANPERDIHITTPENFIGCVTQVADQAVDRPPRAEAAR